MARTPSAPRRQPNRSGPRRAILGWALGAPSRVAVLRLLSAGPEAVSQRELARRAGVQVRSAQQAVAALERLGLVNRLLGGRDHLISFNDAHIMAEPLRLLFAAEADAFRALREELAATVGRAPGLLSLVLFGSVARAADTPWSDLDVLLIAADERARDRLHERLEAAVTALRERHGVALRVIAYTLHEARPMWRARRAPFNTIAIDAVTLAGRAPSELLQ